MWLATRKESSRNSAGSSCPLARVVEAELDLLWIRTKFSEIAPLSDLWDLLDMCFTRLGSLEKGIVVSEHCGVRQMFNQNTCKT